MKSILVGYSGFVGSNLDCSIDFDSKFDHRDIEKSYNLKPDILVYSGVPGNKTMANNSPENDFKVIQSAIENIRRIGAKKVILISTIDVYSHPQNVNEDNLPNPDCAYGKNRAYLEEYVRKNVKDYHIIRLPAIYGKNLKKNLVYDIIHPIPPFLNETTYKKFAQISSSIEKNYTLDQSGFYALKTSSKINQAELEKFFKSQNFSTLSFTDSRAIFQFLNLNHLKKIIEIVTENNIRIFNVATPPISTKELLKYVINTNFKNEIKNDFQNYNFVTKYSSYFGRQDGYIFSKEEVLKDLYDYIKRTKDNEGI